MPERPKIAALVTVYRKHSHAQHFVDRFLDGYGWESTHHVPPMDLVSLYVDQIGADDLSKERAARHPGLRLCKTISEALTLGTGKLAVDGVVVIAEHGDYPKTEMGQVKYPRYKFFQKTVEVFRSSGRSVPVFNDKHLSWNWKWAKEMYDTSRTMGFPLMAGSSLPLTWRTPSIDLPFGAKLQEAVTLCYGNIDGYDIHGLEAMQAMVERRTGGETGVKWLQAWRGADFWAALRDGAWSRKLMEAAMYRSHTLASGREGFAGVPPTPEQLRKMVPDPIAYCYEHNDGLKSTLLLMNGLVADCNFAAQVEGLSISTQMYLPMPPDRTSLANFFSPQVNHIERMVLTGQAAIPLERTLLTTGLTAAGVESLFRSQSVMDTPHLNIVYQAPVESTYWRT